MNNRDWEALDIASADVSEAILELAMITSDAHWIPPSALAHVLDNLEPGLRRMHEVSDTLANRTAPSLSINASTILDGLDAIGAAMLASADHCTVGKRAAFAEHAGHRLHLPHRSVS